MKRDRKIRIALYARQPVLAPGLAAVLRGHRDFRLVATPDSLAALLACLDSAAPDLLLVYVAGGIGLSDLHRIRAAGHLCRLVLWGEDLEGDFAFQAMQCGVRGILPAATPVSDLLSAFRSIHAGALCFQPNLLEDVLSHRPVALSPRQSQVVSLVAQGCKNKQIAGVMGITEGTVKVYLYKLFKKLGVNDRLDLALYGRKTLFSGPGATLPNPGRAAPAPVLLMPRKTPAVPVIQ